MANKKKYDGMNYYVTMGKNYITYTFSKIMLSYRSN